NITPIPDPKLRDKRDISRFYILEPVAQAQLERRAIAVIALRQQRITIDAIGLRLIQKVLALKADIQPLGKAIGGMSRDPCDRIGFLIEARPQHTGRRRKPVRMVAGHTYRHRPAFIEDTERIDRRRYALQRTLFVLNIAL